MHSLKIGSSKSPMGHPILTWRWDTKWNKMQPSPKNEYRYVIGEVGSQPKTGPFNLIWKVLFQREPKCNGARWRAELRFSGKFPGGMMPELRLEEGKHRWLSRGTQEQEKMYQRVTSKGQVSALLNMEAKSIYKLPPTPSTLKYHFPAPSSLKIFTPFLNCTI